MNVKTTDLYLLVCHKIHHVTVDLDRRLVSGHLTKD